MNDYTTFFEKNLSSLSPEQLERLKVQERRYREAARKLITERVAFFQPLTGGCFTSITIRDQKTRWGSCSARGTLSFNYRLIFAPRKILDYVVVHELCHLTHMNHSKEFWALVGQVMPDYKERRKWLKEHGHSLTMINHLFKKGTLPLILG